MISKKRVLVLFAGLFVIEFLPLRWTFNMNDFLEMHELSEGGNC